MRREQANSDAALVTQESAGNVVMRDKVCAACGYSLRGLLEEGVCRKCGKGVRESRAQDRRDWARAKVGAGVVGQAMVIQVWLVIGYLIAKGMKLIPAGESSLIWSAMVAWGVCVLAEVMRRGAFMLTAPGRMAGRALAQVVRAVAVLTVVMGLLGAVIQTAVWLVYCSYGAA